MGLESWWEVRHVTHSSFIELERKCLDLGLSLVAFLVCGGHAASEEPCPPRIKGVFEIRRYLFGVLTLREAY